LNKKDFLKLKCLIPSTPEQKRIAHFFTVLDKKINHLKEKKAILEEYKKGVMQKMFSQEIRFKDDDGNEFAEWEVKRLGEISTNIMYGMNASATKFDGQNKYLRITDIDENSRQYIPNPTISPDGKIEKKYKLMKGDIVFARTGASVGKSYLYKQRDGNLLFAGFLIRFSIIEDNPYFIYSQTLMTSYNKWVISMSMRSGQPGINAEEYKSYKLLIPQLNEQTKIADFLSKIDDKINAVNEQLLETQNYKKGLLQKMYCV
jgi:type I restriction enzyme, S subunit